MRAANGERCELRRAYSPEETCIFLDIRLETNARARQEGQITGEI